MRLGRSVPSIAFAGLLVASGLSQGTSASRSSWETTLLPAFFSLAALLLAPYWAFGFGFGEWLAARVNGTARTLAPLALILPYLIFALPRGAFRWDLGLGMAGIVLAVWFLAPYARADWLVLAIFGVSVDLHFFDRAWRRRA